MAQTLAQRFVAGAVSKPDAAKAVARISSFGHAPTSPKSAARIRFVAEDPGLLGAAIATLSRPRATQPHDISFAAWLMMALAYAGTPKAASTLAQLAARAAEAKHDPRGTFDMLRRLLRYARGGSPRVDTILAMLDREEQSRRTTSPASSFLQAAGVAVPKRKWRAHIVVGVKPGPVRSYDPEPPFLRLYVRGGDARAYEVEVCSRSGKRFVEIAGSTVAEELALPLLRDPAGIKSYAATVAKRLRVRWVWPDVFVKTTLGTKPTHQITQWLRG